MHHYIRLVHSSTINREIDLVRWLQMLSLDHSRAKMAQSCVHGTQDLPLLYCSTMERSHTYSNILAHVQTIENARLHRKLDLIAFIAAC
jgi:hypothetical protein